jgi:hypothetical protein
MSALCPEAVFRTTTRDVTASIGFTTSANTGMANEHHTINKQKLRWTVFKIGELSLFKLTSSM